jgi:hypothetical protein
MLWKDRNVVAGDFCTKYRQHHSRGGITSSQHPQGSLRTRHVGSVMVMGRLFLIWLMKAVLLNHDAITL